MRQTMTPIDIGWIHYLNLVPFYVELRHLVGDTLNFVSGHPTTINKWLADGVVDLAPASSISLLRSPDLKMALPLGIASEGAVKSVYIGLHRHHEKFWYFVQQRQKFISLFFSEFSFVDDREQLMKILKEINEQDVFDDQLPHLVVTPASAASVALSKIFLHLWCGHEAANHIISCSDALDKTQVRGLDPDKRSMELVIGDEALARRPEFCRVLDLGELWHEITRLPFVFGLWQTRTPSLPGDWIEVISTAAKRAEQKMKLTPKNYFPKPMPVAVDGAPIDLQAYWSVIHYHLTSRHFKSLMLYYQLYHLLVDDTNEAGTNKLQTWIHESSVEFASLAR
jgi:chorismate dehydratase